MWIKVCGLYYDEFKIIVILIIYQHFIFKKKLLEYNEYYIKYCII